MKTLNIYYCLKEKKNNHVFCEVIIICSFVLKHLLQQQIFLFFKVYFTCVINF